MTDSRESYGIGEGQFSAVKDARQTKKVADAHYSTEYIQIILRFMYIKSLAIPAACYKPYLSQMEKHLAVD